MVSPATIGLLGASGTLGSRVAANLAARGVPTRLILRRPHASESALHHAIYGDLDRPASLTEAFAGLRTLILITAEGPAQSTQGLAAIEAARDCGIGHIVMASAMLAAATSAPHFGGQHGRIEHALAASGIPHVILRPSFFMQSFLLFKRDIARGRMIIPVPTGRVAFVELEDVADAVAICAMDLGNAGKIDRPLVLTGEQALPFGDIAAVMSSVLGQRVRHVAPPLWLARMMMALALGRYAAANLGYLFACLEAGREASPSPDLRTLLGRPPGTFDQFIRRERAAFRA